MAGAAAGTGPPSTATPAWSPTGPGHPPICAFGVSDGVRLDREVHHDERRCALPRASRADARGASAGRRCSGARQASMCRAGDSAPGHRSPCGSTAWTRHMSTSAMWSGGRGSRPSSCRRPLPTPAERPWRAAPSRSHHSARRPGGPILPHNRGCRDGVQGHAEERPAAGDRSLPL